MGTLYRCPFCKKEYGEWEDFYEHVYECFSSTINFCDNLERLTNFFATLPSEKRERLIEIFKKTEDHLLDANDVMSFATFKIYGICGPNCEKCSHRFCDNFSIFIVLIGAIRDGISRIVNTLKYKNQELGESDDMNPVYEKFANAINALSQLESELSKRTVEIKKMLLDLGDAEDIESPAYLIQALTYSTIMNICLLKHLTEKLQKSKCSKETIKFINTLYELFAKLENVIHQIDRAVRLSKDFVDTIDFLEGKKKNEKSHM
ncbi:MAG: hypothetical protein ACTSXX_06485 [Candidatus Baldrarchaeia archaeon]